ncbi:MAG: cytochrome c biogenesis protein CcsA [Myxococcales bacterium]|nr:cytochrome c biogenesis protein CcsA [Myxococcales bacterium]
MRWFKVLAAVAFAMLGLTIYLALEYAPIAQDAAGGLSQKIFYIHVPSAYVMYLGVTACVMGSLGYLIQRRPGWDALAQAGGELAVLFATLVLITGPLWARKAWGTYWAWDPRLTTTLLGMLIFVAYLVLHGSAGAGEAEKRFSSALAVLGACVMPVIHFSVRLWRGQHPTVISSAGGGLAPEMGKTLGVSFAAFTLVAVALLWMRANLALGEARLEAMKTEAVSLGMLEDDDAEGA